MSRLEQLQKLALIAPDDPMSHYGLGLEFINLAQWDSAVAAFAEAVRVDPGYSAAYYQKGRAEIEAGRATDALQTLDAGISIARGAGDWHTAEEMSALRGTIA